MKEESLTVFCMLLFYKLLTCSVLFLLDRFHILYAVVIVRDKDWYSIAYKGRGRLLSDIFVFTYYVNFPTNQHRDNSMQILSFVEEIFIRIFAALVLYKNIVFKLKILP